MSKKILLYVSALLAACTLITSCLGNDNNSTYLYAATSSSNSLVREFKLRADEKVLAHLDSVYFTIDPERGIIYNADSLPLGTDVSRLLVTITFQGTIGGAAFVCTGSKLHRDTTFNYRTSENDSVDFTGEVHLKVASYDGTFTKDYRVMVNVHKTKPDSIHWRKSYTLPLSDVKALRTAAIDDHYVTLARTASGHVIATHNLATSQWQTKIVTLPFEPVIESFAASDDALYVLAVGGELYRSDDEGLTWNATGQTWTAIVGGYDDRVLGLSHDEEGYKHVEYPAPAGFQPRAIDPNFPVSGFSQLVGAQGAWDVTSQVMMAGGRLADGTCTPSVWGYDGSNWGLLSNTLSAYQLPSIAELILVPYTSVTYNTTRFITEQHDVWLVMGGVNGLGMHNTGTYSSSNHGITWVNAASTQRMPIEFAELRGAQAFVVESTYDSTSPKAPRRISKPVTSWSVNTIYVIGGVNAAGDLNTAVLEGVLTQFTYKPLQ